MIQRTKLNKFYAFSMFCIQACIKTIYKQNPKKAHEHLFIRISLNLNQKFSHLKPDVIFLRFGDSQTLKFLGNIYMW